jgi:hypothetical protein
VTPLVRASTNERTGEVDFSSLTRTCGSVASASSRRWSFTNTARAAAGIGRQSGQVDEMMRGAGIEGVFRNDYREEPAVLVRMG